MVARRDVALLEVAGFQGTGFLIAPDKLATALHVIVELDDDREVVRDQEGQPVPLGPLVCTFFTEQRGHWCEQVEFVPGRDPCSISGDWVVLTVTNATGVRVWKCTPASASDRLGECSTYGFPPPYGNEGAPYHGKLTGVADPCTTKVTDCHIPLSIQVHRAWFVEAVSPSGLSPMGFSGAPVVMDDYTVGMMRSFIRASEAGQDVAGDSAVGATVLLTPIEALLVGADIEPSVRPSARKTVSSGPDRALVHIDTRGSDLLVDNWLLQSVSGLLTGGPDRDTTSMIELDVGRDVHHLRDVSAAGVEFECLIGLINDIILRERLVLDKAFTGGWHGQHPELDSLVDSGVLAVREIDGRAEISRFAKGRVIGHLCATSTLSQLNLEHLGAIRAGQKSPHSFIISQMIAGTGGNFGRSAVIRTPYSPHPLRQVLIEQTLFRRPTAVDGVTKWLESERANVHSHRIGDIEIGVARIMLPPLVVQVIEDSATVSELIPVALQYRERFAHLRDWIGVYQNAMDDEDPRAMLNRQRVLESVAAHLASMRAEARYGRTGISIVTRWFKLGQLRQRVGVRGALNGLVTTPAGEGALTKLLEMFEVAGTSLEYRVREHLSRRFRADRSMT